MREVTLPGTEQWAKREDDRALVLTKGPDKEDLVEVYAIVPAPKS